MSTHECSLTEKRTKKETEAHRHTYTQSMTIIIISMYSDSDTSNGNGDVSVRYIAEHNTQSAHTILSKAISVNTRAHEFLVRFAMMTTTTAPTTAAADAMASHWRDLRHNFFLVIDSNHYDVIYFFAPPPSPPPSPIRAICHFRSLLSLPEQRSAGRSPPPLPLPSSSSRPPPLPGTQVTPNIFHLFISVFLCFPRKKKKNYRAEPEQIQNVSFVIDGFIADERRNECVSQMREKRESFN